MILTFLTGVVLGLIVAIPPGPVMVVIVRGVLHSGKEYALRIAYGIALFDVAYSFTFSLAAGSVLRAFDAVLLRFPYLPTLLQALAITGLISYGIWSLRANLHKAAKGLPDDDEPTPTNDNDANPNEGAGMGRFTRKIAAYGPFFIGVALSLTHLANPTFIPLMTTVSIVAQKYGFMQIGVLEQHVAFALGYASGVLAWLAILTFATWKYRNVFSHSILLRINRLLGITMIGFGAYWGYERFAHLAFLFIRNIFQIGFAL
jgi:threonine/homoserine/homoserine lactone efflux protein